MSTTLQRWQMTERMHLRAVRVKFEDNVAALGWFTSLTVRTHQLHVSVEHILQIDSLFFL
jgi:hypothetical protein